MASSTKFYGLDRLTINLSGIPVDSGFAVGTVCKVVEDAARFGDKVGADGEVTRYRMLNRMATVTIRTMQSSDLNGRLTGLGQADDAAPNGAGVGTLLIKDEDGTSKYLMPQAWVSKPPDVEFADEVTEREWTIRGQLAVRIDGGN